MTKLAYDGSRSRLDFEADEDPTAVLNRLRAWATDERRQVLFPPLLRQHAERLLTPKPRGRRRLPPIVLAAFMAEYAATETPRGKAFARQYGIAEGTTRGWKYKAAERGLADGDYPSDEAERLLSGDQRTPEEIIRGFLRRGG